MLPTIIALVGAPGSGKTSVVKKIAEKYSNFIAIDIDELLLAQPLDEFFKSSLQLLMPYIERARIEKKIIVVSHVDFDIEAIKRYANFYLCVVFTPFAVNIKREIERDKPDIMPLKVANFYIKMFTGNPELGVGPVLETLTHKKIETAMSPGKTMFSSQLELYNWTGTFIARLNVKHTQHEIKIYARRVINSSLLIMSAQELDARVETLYEFTQGLEKNRPVKSLLSPPDKSEADSHQHTPPQ